MQLVIEQHRTKQPGVTLSAGSHICANVFLAITLNFFLPFHPHLLTLFFQIPLSPAEFTMVYISLSSTSVFPPWTNTASLPDFGESIIPDQWRLTNLPLLN